MEVLHIRVVFRARRKWNVKEVTRPLDDFGTYSFAHPSLAVLLTMALASLAALCPYPAENLPR